MELPERIAAADQIRFEHPAFTFVRIKYSDVRSRSRSSASGAWSIDYPDADLNFAIRFQAETGLRVDTNGLVLELTDARLKQYPFIYLVEGGQLDLSADEVQSLQRVPAGGGFLMVDDFWGEPEWDHVRAQMKRVFPDRDAVDLPITHPLFHCFYELKEKPQVPNVMLGMESLNPNSTNYGQTWERPEAREAHYRGLRAHQVANPRVGEPRRVRVCAVGWSVSVWVVGGLPIENRRYGRLQTCATGACVFSVVTQIWEAAMGSYLYC